MKPGEGNIDFSDVFQGIEEAGYVGHYLNAFGALRDMLEARGHLTACPKNAGTA